MKERRRRKIWLSAVMAAALLTGNTGAVLADVPKEESPVFEVKEPNAENEVPEGTGPVQAEEQKPNETPLTGAEEEVKSSADDEQLTETPGNESAEVPLVPPEQEKSDKNQESEPEIPEEEEVHQHDAACGFREARPEIPCDHHCEDMDNDKKIDHCEECSYQPAEEAKPCQVELARQREEEQKRLEEEKKQEEQKKSEEEQKKQEEQKKLEEEQKTLDEQQNMQEENLSDGQQTEGSKPAETEGEEQPPDSIIEASEKTTEKEDEQEKNQQETEGNQDSLTEESEMIQGEPESNEPAFAVEIPAQVCVNETNSFTIQTKKLRPQESGTLIVTVEGTQSEDGRNFALYCGSNSWEYQLELCGTYLTPLQNQAKIDTWEETRNVNIIPATGEVMAAGNYEGVLMFRVVYEK